MEALNRTYIGIRLPSEVISQIDQALMLVKRKPGVTDVRWNAPTELLINICSLGELAPETVYRLPSIVGPICSGFPRMRLTIAGLSGTPNLIQPRYVVATLSGDLQTITDLAARLDHAVTPYLPHRDVRPFQPQIILGRLKTETEPGRVALGRALRLLQIPPIGEIYIDAIELLISSASTSGMGYEVIQRLALGGQV